METPVILHSDLSELPITNRFGSGFHFRLSKSVVVRLAATVFAFVAVSGASTAAETLPTRIADILSASCTSCHDGTTTKGGVRLDNLAGLALQPRLDLLNKIQEQIFSDEIAAEE